MLPAQPNQSLIDGLACLQFVAGAPMPIGSRDLARQLELEPTRINRLLKTLAALGLLEQNDQRKYQPGPAIHVLAAQSLFASQLLRRAIGPLESLHALGFTVALGVLWRSHVSYLYHAQPGMNAAAALGRAGLFPAQRSGIGVALMALSKQPLPRLPGLATLVKSTRRLGYALVPTGTPQQMSLGLALSPQSGAAIALAGRIRDDRVEPLVAALRQAAAEIDLPIPPPSTS